MFVRAEFRQAAQSTRINDAKKGTARAFFSAWVFTASRERKKPRGRLTKYKQKLRDRPIKAPVKLPRLTDRLQKAFSLKSAWRLRSTVNTVVLEKKSEGGSPREKCIGQKDWDAVWCSSQTLVDIRPCRGSFFWIVWIPAGTAAKSGKRGPFFLCTELILILQVEGARRTKEGIKLFSLSYVRRNELGSVVVDIHLDLVPRLGSVTCFTLAKVGKNLCVTWIELKIPFQV